MEFLIAFGQAFRSARKGANLSQEKLALAAGVHRNTVSLIEQGDVSVSIQTLKVLCDEMGCLPWQVFLETQFLLDRTESNTRKSSRTT